MSRAHQDHKIARDKYGTVSKISEDLARALKNPNQQFSPTIGKEGTFYFTQYSWLHIFAMIGTKDEMTALLGAVKAKGGDINPKAEQKNPKEYTYNVDVTPMYMAAQTGNCAALYALIEAEAEVNSVTSMRSYNSTVAIRSSPLEVAVAHDHNEAIAMLVRAGAKDISNTPEEEVVIDRIAHLGDLLEAARRVYSLRQERAGAGSTPTAPQPATRRAAAQTQAASASIPLLPPPSRRRLAAARAAQAAAASTPAAPTPTTRRETAATALPPRVTADDSHVRALAAAMKNGDNSNIGRLVVDATLISRQQAVEYAEQSLAELLRVLPQALPETQAELLAKIQKRFVAKVTKDAGAEPHVGMRTGSYLNEILTNPATTARHIEARKGFSLAKPPSTSKAKGNVWKEIIDAHTSEMDAGVPSIVAGAGAAVSGKETSGKGARGK